MEIPLMYPEVVAWVRKPCKPLMQRERERESPGLMPLLGCIVLVGSPLIKIE